MILHIWHDAGWAWSLETEEDWLSGPLPVTSPRAKLSRLLGAARGELGDLFPAGAREEGMWVRTVSGWRYTDEEM